MKLSRNPGHSGSANSDEVNMKRLGVVRVGLINK